MVAVFTADCDKSMPKQCLQPKAENEGRNETFDEGLKESVFFDMLFAFWAVGIAF